MRARMGMRKQRKEKNEKKIIALNRDIEPNFAKAKNFIALMESQPTHAQTDFNGACLRHRAVTGVPPFGHFVPSNPWHKQPKSKMFVG